MTPMATAVLFTVLSNSNTTKKPNNEVKFMSKPATIKVRLKSGKYTAKTEGGVIVTYTRGDIINITEPVYKSMRDLVELVGNKPERQQQPRQKER